MAVYSLYTRYFFLKKNNTQKKVEVRLRLKTQKKILFLPWAFFIFYFPFFISIFPFVIDYERPKRYFFLEKVAQEDVHLLFKKKLLKK